jgi:hypothetical protein
VILSVGIQTETRLLGLVADAQSQLQAAPQGHHIHDARQLHHEQRSRVERVVFAGIQEINRPHVNVFFRPVSKMICVKINKEINL